MQYLKNHRVKLIIWSLLLTLGGYLALFNHIAGDTAHAADPIFTFITAEGSLNASGQFTETSGNYIKYAGKPPTPVPTPGPVPTPTCPPPDPNPVVAFYTGNYKLDVAGEQGDFSLIVRQNNASNAIGVPKIEQQYTLVPFDQGTANIALQINGSTGTGTIQLVKNGQQIDTGTITITMKLDVPVIPCTPGDPTPTPTPVPVPTPTPVTPPAGTIQAETRTWTVDGVTYAYVKLTFPDSSYKVTDGGTATATGSDFSVDIKVAQVIDTTYVAVVTTTAQIYPLGKLGAGAYTFTIKTGGTLLKMQPFTISDGAPPANTIDDSQQYVRQQYLDFLGREPDGPGLGFWTNEITICSDASKRQTNESEAQCVARKRVNTSGAFFLSTEFQNTGYFVYRFYKGSFNRWPKFSELKQDAPTLTKGIVVNNLLDQNAIEQNKVDFANNWVARSDFKTRYDGLNNQQYVDQLFTNTGVAPTDEERVSLVNGLNGNTETRATVLRKIVDGARLRPDGSTDFFTNYGKAFYQKEYNPAFVLIQYFGYLQRDPDGGGYDFWLEKLNRLGNFTDAEMVKSFVLSPEYRSRFGQP